MKTSCVLVVAVCLGSIGVAAMLYGAPDDANSKAELERQLNDLRKARVASAQKALEAVPASIEAQTATFEQMAVVVRNLAEAEVDMATKPQEEIAAWEKYVKVAKQVEEGRKRLYDLASRGGEADAYYTAKQESERAQIALLKARLKSLSN